MKRKKRGLFHEINDSPFPALFSLFVDMNTGGLVWIYPGDPINGHRLN